VVISLKSPAVIQQLDAPASLKRLSTLPAYSTTGDMYLGQQCAPATVPVWGTKRLILLRGFLRWEPNRFLSCRSSIQ